MSDVVLPLGGGWVIQKTRLPANLPQLPIFSVAYALPVRAFVRGAHTLRWPDMAEYGGQYGESDLWTLYRFRHTRQQLSEAERAKAIKMEADALVAQGHPIDLEQRVRILTPDGEVCLEPYEWVPVGDIQSFLDMIGSGVTLHEYPGSKVGASLSDAMFYLRSRGLDRVTVARLLFGEVRKPNVFWLEMSKSTRDYFDREAA